MTARQNLDDFISIHCFKAVIIGMEDILGVEGTASAMIAAGRKRGVSVAEEAGLKGKKPPVDSIAATLDKFLGKEGTRLCQVSDVSSTPEGGFLVKTKETVCTAGEPADSQRVCTYTMGAILGFLEAVYDIRLTGSHVANVLKGSASDNFELKPVS